MKVLIIIKSDMLKIKQLLVYQRNHRKINLTKHTNALYFWNGQTTCFMQYLTQRVGLSILTSSRVCFAKEKPLSLMFKNS